MLAKREAAATIAVKSAPEARKFYEGRVGLLPEDTSEPSVVSYKSGKSTIFVYESRYAGSNRATAATWIVDDVEKEVSALKARGIAFEHYDMPGGTWKGDVFVSGKMHAAWFKDPDGNVLAVVGRT